MWDYITSELSDLVFEHFPLDRDRQAITGHSMGGHGALCMAMTLPDVYKSVSAFAPIANPTASDWGRKQLSAYLGADEARWAAYDASLLMSKNGHPNPILVDQGTADNFLDLLRPETLANAMAAKRQAGVFRMQEGYDHSYDFVSSFMRDHIEFHAKALH
jgi:S-formylglutathione hydrolase